MIDPERKSDLSVQEKRELLKNLLSLRQSGGSGGVPLSYNQQSLWFVYQLAPDSPAYNFLFAARIAAGLDIPALVRAFEILMGRHAALRTRFVVRDNKPVQIIEDKASLTVPVTDASALSWEELEELCKRRADEPFDLEHGPALRVELFRVAAGETILLLVFHHIVADLWSMEVLIQELHAVYQAESTGYPLTLEPAPAQFADYVRRQLGAVHGPRGQKAWEYWREQLTGELPVLNLPTDRPRPLVQTYNGTCRTWPLDRNVVLELRALAQAHGATPFMALLAVFEALLYRYSGQDDFLVGSATADRARPEWEQAVGYFLNQVPFRAHVSGDENFTALLERTRDHVFQGLEHQDFPFGLLVKRLQPRRDPSRSPIFQVMFVWDKTRALGHPSAQQAASGNGAGLRLQPLLLEQRGAPFDLTFIVFETKDRLTASFRYNSDLFDRATIERMAGHFDRLLAGVVAAPQQPLSEIDMLSTAERELLLETWNDTALPHEDVAFPRVFERLADAAPQAPAVFFEDQVLTYQDLNARANQLARYLRRLGVRRGQTIALSMPRCPDTIVAVLAAWKLGAGYLFLDPLYPPKRFSGTLADAQPVVLIAPETVQGSVLPTVRLAEERTTIAGESDANLDLTVQPDDPAYVIYTSGSTGRPKGTVLRHRGLSNLLSAQKAVFGMNATDRVLQFASFSFDASVFETVMALGAGASLVMGTLGSLLPGPGLLKLLRDQAVTIATLPPSVPATLPPDDLPALRTLIVAGETCSAEVVAAWAPGRRMFNAYGPTEATVWSTVAQCVADGQAPPIGRPIANTRAYVLDAHLQPVPVGVPGELYVAGPGLALGYLNQPELTAERFLANPFTTADDGVMYRTGDLVRRRHSGDLEFLGRRDLQIKLRGYRIEPEEIQETLRQHSEIADAMVLAGPAQDGQTALVAYVVPRAADTFSVSDVRAYLRERLPHYMIPTVVHVLDRFPLTVNGKVDRARLAEIACRTPAARQMTESQKPLEKLLAGIWTRVLRVDTVGSHDNFFDLGGASVQTLEVVSLAHQAGLTLTPEMIFRHQTVAELAEACGERLPPSEENGQRPIGRNGKTARSLRDTSASAPHVPHGRNGTSSCGAVVESLGTYLPPREMTTDQILEGCRIKLDFPLERMTGIRTRRMAGETEFAVDLAAKAVADCLARSAYGPADIDLLVCSNISRYDGPEFRFTMEPTTAARLRARFGFTNALAFDVTNACAGTFTAISVVDALLRRGVIRRAMVVSGEYITHLTRTAQREIESFMDPRMACLTLGDSGVAMILEQAPNPAVGFQEIDLYTLGKYHNLCVAKVSAHPEGGAIMYTDPVKSAAVTIKEAVKHSLEALNRHGWAPEALKWLIMHQTSEMTLDGAMREINRAVGKQMVHRANTVFHLARRGNTATNSHFLAVRENIEAGKITSGDKVFFAVSGSGQVVGSALYVFDDLPGRLRKTRPVAGALADRAPTSSRGLQTFLCSRGVCIESVGLFSGDLSLPVESVAMLKAAGEACLRRSRSRREDVGLVMHTGTYRSEFLCEPALAAILAGELHINHDGETPGGKRTFAFDLTNGAAGALTGCFLACQLLGAGKFSRALILASEVENNAHTRPSHLIGVKETASALLLEEGRGFTAFAFRTFPEHVGRVEAFTVAHNRQPAVEYRRDPDINATFTECIRTTVTEFLAKVGLDASQVHWFLLPQRSAAFVTGVAGALAVPAERVVFAPDGARDYFTSSLAFSFEQARGKFARGDLVLMVEAAAGIQVACGLYQV
jgi:amino acid adenylation domain-containing protein